MIHTLYLPTWIFLKWSSVRENASRNNKCSLYIICRRFWTNIFRIQLSYILSNSVRLVIGKKWKLAGWHNHVNKRSDLWDKESSDRGWKPASHRGGSMALGGRRKQQFEIWSLDLEAPGGPLSRRGAAGMAGLLGEEREMARVSLKGVRTMVQQSKTQLKQVLKLWCINLKLCF